MLNLLLSYYWPEQSVGLDIGGCFVYHGKQTIEVADLTYWGLLLY